MTDSTPSGNKEIRQLLETLTRQINNGMGAENGLSLIERDLIKATLRNLYLQIDQYNSIEVLSTQETQVDPVSVLPDLKAATSQTPAPSNTNTQLVAEVMSTLFSSQQNQESHITPSDIKIEDTVHSVPLAQNTNTASGSIESIANTLPTPLDPSPGVITEELSAMKEERPVIQHQPVAETKTETTAIEEKTIAARIQQVRAANLFDEPSTIGGKYAAQETLGDKIIKSKTGKSVAETLKSQPLADLKQSIGINERFSFINELFSGDQALYHQSIENINKMMTYEDAHRLIHEDLAVQLKWNTDTERFKQFDELVKRRFNL